MLQIGQLQSLNECARFSGSQLREMRPAEAGAPAVTESLYLVATAALAGTDARSSAVFRSSRE
jgi:hypothetical protein